MRRVLIAAAFGITAIFATAGGAVEPAEMLDDPVLEQRARDITLGLRCLVCRNQSIDDSNAGLARDLRVLVRERLAIGDSDQDVLRFVVDRYGDFVLLRPPVKPATYVLWFTPVALLLIGVAVLFQRFRRRRPTAPAALPRLSEEEQAAVARLLEEGRERP